MQINETQLKELQAYLLELPAKYANPIFEFLGNIAKEQGVQQAEAPKKD
jgi:hypothetical protein